MSTKPPNIFISWSGPRSKHVAKALNEWLPTVLQSARPWFSTLSIDKGSRPLDEIAKALEDMKIGISCLTLENLTSPWLLYEAGALSKSIGTKARLCTYLLGGLGPEGVPPPLGMFQHTRADKEETKHMLRSINIAISDDPVPEPALDKLFERMWPDLKDVVSNMPPPDTGIPEKRPLEDMIEEVLGVVRNIRPEMLSAISAMRLSLSHHPTLARLEYLSQLSKSDMSLQFVCALCENTGFEAVDDKMVCTKCRGVNCIKTPLFNK